ncbi:unnamed protein product [Lactuca virosa]|uniref:Uncharacterized protein n=1 Tax=Lactuca virosa TaxID=75947 RepID=A0AAU9MDH5_9ASTR|nr:unnamed protein product [Lactuca virosa]
MDRASSPSVAMVHLNRGMRMMFSLPRRSFVLYVNSVVHVIEPTIGLIKLLKKEFLNYNTFVMYLLRDNLTLCNSNMVMKSQKMKKKKPHVQQYCVGTHKVSTKFLHKIHFIREFDGVQFEEDGYTSCVASGPRHCKINNGGCWNESRDWFIR